MVNDRLINRMNISTIMLLPLFQSILTDFNKKKKKKNSIHTVITLFFQYGLLNCYLYDNITTNKYTLKLLFNKNLLTTKIPYTNKSYFSLFDIIILSEYFIGMRNCDDLHVVLYLQIDKKWNDDIEKIENSEYSKTSIEFKKEITLESCDVELSDDEDANTIVLQQLGPNIAYKTKELQKHINNLYNANVTDPPELYKQFDVSKETIFFNINNDKNVKDKRSSDKTQRSSRGQKHKDRSVST